MSEYAEPTIQLPTERQSASDPERALKSLAKTLARDSVADISDRHVRAQVRTRCYNQLVSLLRQFDSQRAADRHRQRRLLSAAGGVIVVLAAALIGSLLV